MGVQSGDNFPFLATPSPGAHPRSMSSPTAKASPSHDLEAELRQAIVDLESGNYIELTPEQIDAWAETGEVPWPDDESHE